VPDNTPLTLNLVQPEDFTVHNFDDELRVDTLCRQLLLAIRDVLLGRVDLSPLQVGKLCHGADLFLRDFVIAVCGDNLFHLPSERVRQFAGHWYIVNTLEPNVAELSEILDGIAACYEVLAGRELVESTRYAAIAAACADLPGYQQRIEDFWAITGDGYDRWRAACPLPIRPA